jgi:hypothetical protein
MPVTFPDLPKEITPNGQALRVHRRAFPDPAPDLGSLAVSAASIAASTGAANTRSVRRLMIVPVQGIIEEFFRDGST